MLVFPFYFLNDLSMSTGILSKPYTNFESQNLPRGEELPYDDGEPLESERHLFQIFLLLETLQPWLQKLGKGYLGGNMFLYFSPKQVKTEMVRGPDFFVVSKADFRERKSWVVWEEGLSPNVVIELLSDTTKHEDKTNKKRIYEKEVCVNEYYWYDPHNPNDWAGHELIMDNYHIKQTDIRGRYISKELDLALVRWHGVFLEREATWLRFETIDGFLLPTKQELAQEERQKAEQERQKAEQEKQRADALARKLREMGIDPNNL
ncbi:MAG: Uma2 family endonuclease [Leptospiraceae bacterium]|nr:Uma2 family endonuclease [Leptospiraceae bacterium]